MLFLGLFGKLFEIVVLGFLVNFLKLCFLEKKIINILMVLNYFSVLISKIIL